MGKRTRIDTRGSQPVKWKRQDGLTYDRVDWDKHGEDDNPLLGDDPQTKEVVSKLPKKKYAVCFGYIGSDYFGMQKQPETNVPTVESALEEAIHSAGGIADCNYGDLAKVQWSRAGRTDKGVHAASQVVSLRLSCGKLEDKDFAWRQKVKSEDSSSLGVVAEEEDSEAIKQITLARELEFLKRLRDCVPKSICIHGIIKVNKSFNARTMCSARQYEYILPTWILRRMKFIGNSDVVDKLKTFTSAEPMPAMPTATDMEYVVNFMRSKKCSGFLTKFSGDLETLLDDTLRAEEDSAEASAEGAIPRECSKSLAECLSAGLKHFRKLKLMPCVAEDNKEVLEQIGSSLSTASDLACQLDETVQGLGPTGEKPNVTALSVKLENVSGCSSSSDVANTPPPSTRPAPARIPSQKRGKLCHSDFEELAEFVYDRSKFWKTLYQWRLHNQWIANTYRALSEEHKKEILSLIAANTSCVEDLSTATIPHQLFAYRFEDISEAQRLAHRISDSELSEFESILKRLIGTHHWYNYTSKLSPDDPSGKRYISDIAVSRLDLGEESLRSQGEYLVISIKGQSFLLNQIRKMISMVVEVFIGSAPADALEFLRDVRKPKKHTHLVPGEGLFLSVPFYDAYNCKRQENCNPIILYPQENDDISFLDEITDIAQVHDLVNNDHTSVWKSVEFFRQKVLLSYVVNQLSQSISVWNTFIHDVLQHPCFLENFPQPVPAAVKWNEGKINNNPPPAEHTTESSTTDDPADCDNCDHQ